MRTAPVMVSLAEAIVTDAQPSAILTNSILTDSEHVNIYEHAGKSMQPTQVERKRQRNGRWEKNDKNKGYSPCEHCLYCL